MSVYKVNSQLLRDQLTSLAVMWASHLAFRPRQSPQKITPKVCGDDRAKTNQGYSFVLHVNTYYSLIDSKIIHFNVFGDNLRIEIHKVMVRGASFYTVSMLVNEQ